ncbi:MAG: segregation/condensation protein A [Lachnospiraceae bacterium]|nr:segregation/condensation protein A [Lachnospiraceae bacterium]
MPLEIRLDAFEGPLDLLLHLIKKNKVDIYDIPVALITGQYMEYLDSMEDADMDIMSDFLVMASTLLDIKSRMLLPKEKTPEGEEIDPRDELVNQLLEYKIYKYMSYELKDMQSVASKSVFRCVPLPDELKNAELPIDYDVLIGDRSVQLLKGAFHELMKRAQDKIDPIRSKFGRIEKEEIRIDEKMEEIRSFAEAHGEFTFRELLGNAFERAELVVTFLCLLEYIRTGEFSVVQRGKEIYITVNPEFTKASA